jgi:eukaryotic-like serine/threonine-protein kinase
VTLASGTRLGPYEILAPLGAGGMGEVYRARDTRLGRELAVKVLPSALASDAERLKRFEKEARSASALNHPNIVTIHDIGESDGTSFIAMEMVDGQTLREILAEGALPTKRLLPIAAQVADGLAKAHGAGIVHRDLKPENVMVTKDGFVKILDFGLAKLTQPEDSSGATASPTVSGGTEPGIVMGTIGYMSPEQALGKALDFRSDQFSFGSILYELATGKRAFSRGSSPETMSAIIREEPEPIGSLAPLTPAPLRWIVERCLAKTPDDRYASTRDLARDLSNLRDRLPEASGATAAAATRSRVGAPKWMRVALGMATFAALVAALLLRPARKEAPPAGPTRFLVDTPSSASFYGRPPVTGLALSPDGRRIAFIAGSATRFQLWVRSLDEVEPRPLPGTEWAASPFWSPDGRQVAFFAGGKLQRIAVAGGPAQVICETPFGSSGAWSPGGVIAIGQWEGGGESGLLRVSAEGGTPVALTRAAPKHLHLWPEFLPDGRHLLFLDGEVGGGKHVVCIGSLDSAEIRPLFEADSRAEYAPPGYLVFVRDATLLARPFDLASRTFTGEATPVAQAISYFRRTGSGAFAVSPQSRVLAYQPRPFDSRLVWLDREGHALGSVGAPALFHQPPRLSPDGRRVAVSVRDPKFGFRDIWIYDVASGLPTRLTSSPGDGMTPIWSPDGSRIAYASAREGAPDVYIRDLASGREAKALSLAGTQVPFGWSPDGAHIAYGDYSPTRRPPFRIGLISLGAGAPEPPPPGPPYSEYGASYSPDGRWMVLVSEESGEPEVYIVPTVGSGERRRVSSAGGDHPRWRGDGRELYYLDDGGKLIAVAVSYGASGIEVGSTRVLFSAGAAAIDFDVTAAGDRFLFQMGTEARAQPPIVVTLDWAAGLGK